MKYSFTLAALATVASGHTIFQRLVAGGTEYGMFHAMSHMSSMIILNSCRHRLRYSCTKLRRSMLITPSHQFYRITNTNSKPINDVSTSYITCNGGPNPTTGSNKIIEVKAGETVKAKWRKVLDGTTYIIVQE